MQLTIILLMLAGVFAGALIGRLFLRRESGRPERRMRLWRRVTGAAITVIIWVLLFLLGVEVGCDDSIISGFATLGVRAVVLAASATLGSCVAAWALWRFCTRKHRNGAPLPGSSAAGERQEKQSLWKMMRGSLIIVAFFVAGILCALGGLLRLTEGDSDLSFIALCTLMMFVGMSVGSDLSALKSLRTLSPALLLLPVMTVVGTLAGCALVTPLMRGTLLTDNLAVGCGFAYYSLSSIFITGIRGAALGAVALTSNITREILTLMLAPFMCRAFGPLAPISAGGATSADTTFGAIVAASGQQFAVLSIFHGFLVDFSVPFLVTFFCTI